MQIRVPKGYPAVSIDSLSTFGGEDEVLLQHGSHFVVRGVGVDATSGKTLVHLDAFVPKVKSQSGKGKGSSSSAPETRADHYTWKEDDIVFHPASSKGNHQKYNDVHAENGQFGFAGGSGGGGGGASSVLKPPALDDPAYDTSTFMGPGHTKAVMKLRQQGQNVYQQQLSREKQFEIDDYIRSSTDVNGALRHPGADVSARTTESVTTLGTIIGQEKLDQAVVSYRGMTGKGHTLEYYKQNIGAVIEDKGFTSTTLSLETADKFSGERFSGVVLAVRVPKGYSAMAFEKITQWAGEDELLLQHGSHFIVRGIATSADGKPIVNVDAFLPKIGAAGKAKEHFPESAPESRQDHFTWKESDILFHVASVVKKKSEEQEIDAILDHPKQYLKKGNQSYQQFRALVAQEKYNEIHAENGEFGFAGGSGGGGSSGKKPVPPFPGRDDFEEATLTRFPGGVENKVFSTTIQGKQYFVKETTSGASPGVEVAASQMAADIGLADQTIPVKLLSMDEKKYLVSPWTTLKPFADYPKEGQAMVAGDLSVQDFTRIHAYHFLTNDADRNPGNTLMDTETGKVKVIDMEYSLGSTRGLFNPRASTLEKMRAVSQGTTVEELALDPATLADVAAKTSQFKQHMITNIPNVSQKGVNAMQLRITHLKTMAANGVTTVSGLQDVWK